jgi:predicted AAA+ superfamily ATPase
MLQILAFQCGEPISYNDIAQRCGVDNETIERYIDLFERTFLLIKLPSFYNGHRYELKKTHCVYFQDNGIRNALIQNFNPPELRNDMDLLWRNYMVSERVKWIRSLGLQKEMFFWRTHTQQQMDFIEVDADKIMAYKSDPNQFSYAKRKTVKVPKLFQTYYPQAKTGILNKSTYWNFLTRKV